MNILFWAKLLWHCITIFYFKCNFPFLEVGLFWPWTLETPGPLSAPHPRVWRYSPPALLGPVNTANNIAYHIQLVPFAACLTFPCVWLFRLLSSLPHEEKDFLASCMNEYKLLCYLLAYLERARHIFFVKLGWFLAVVFRVIRRHMSCFLICCQS